MTTGSIPALRLAAQHISRPTKLTAAKLVEQLVAVQSQDFAGAKWALGLRLTGVDDAEVVRAYDAGEILRTHVLRPTWHFVAPADIRALLRLTGPRILKQNQSIGRRLGLTNRHFAKCTDLIARALSGGNFLTRDALRSVLEEAGVATMADHRMAYYVMHAELNGVICSGPRLGKQFSYALLDERVPSRLDAGLDNEALLVQLAERFLQSRGPSTERDFAWWAGRTLSDARRAFDTLRPGLRRISHDGTDFWLASDPVRVANRKPAALLLSIYDEYISSYRSREVIVTPADGARLIGQGNALAWLLVLNGQVAGTWRRVVERGGIRVELESFRRLTAPERQAVDAMVARYAKFLNTAVTLHISGSKS